MIKATFTFFLEPFAHINRRVNIGANSAQSEIKESKISIEIKRTFHTIFLTFSAVRMIQKHMSNVKIIFNPRNSNIPFFVNARQYGISEIKAKAINL